MPLLTHTAKGIYCQQANIYIDPSRKVEKALITHAHADHSRFGHDAYLAHLNSVPIMKHRLGNINLEGIEYGKPIRINGVQFSFHPAGHIPGSSQIRVEHKGEVWVASGDYKRQNDGISTPFEVVRCHHFITESTFGLPVYRWQPQETVFNDIHKWWRANAEAGKTSILSGYSLGKAQRLLMHLDRSIGPVYCHPAIDNINALFREHHILDLPKTHKVEGTEKKEDYRRAIVVAPPSVLNSSWINKFSPYSIGISSGWMALRGARRRRNADRGFVMSDHADWDALNQTIKETGAHSIYVTHGYREILSKWLCTQGYNAKPLEIDYEDESD